MEIHDIVMHIHRNNLPAVLATLIEVEGHSYRKAGAVMLFFEGGTLGSLSPGCLESDLQLRTTEVWERGIPEMVEYDMLSPDDFSWGEAVGCGGKIKVVLEPVKGELYKVLQNVNNRLDQGEDLVLFREVAGERYAYTLESGGGNQLPQCENNARLSHQTKESLAEGKFKTTSSGLVAFRTLFVPKPRLVIFGGGHDAGPVAEFASRVGFRIAVADWREGSLQIAFPGAERLICSPADAVLRLGVGRGDYVLICSHQFQRDRQFLEKVIPQAPHYIGIIGSKARISLLLEGLDTPESLHAPVGLSIGGEGPEEIAVSIVAELISIRRAYLQQQPKGVENDESSRYISGSRAEQADGSVQSFTEAISGSLSRERRAQ